MPNTDFDGDGRDDIIWRHNPTGLVTNWLGQPDGSFAGNADAGLDPWAIGHLIGIGDFDADGRSDTLWRLASNDLYLSQTYEGGAFYFHWSLGFVAKVGADRQVAGIGDFNGDGRDDVLWRQDSGTLSQWQSQAGNPYVFNTTVANQSVNPVWNVAGIGDFNGDGRDDILWRHQNGTVTDWLGQTDGTFFGNFAAAAYAVDPAWKIAGTGDFNGDGRDDILWRHDNGTVTNWLGQADGTFFGNFAAAAYAVDPAWKVAGTGDYNGGGRDDILWRHDNGTVTNWLGQAGGTFVDNFAAASYAVDVSWQIQPNLSGAGFWDY